MPSVSYIIKLLIFLLAFFLPVSIYAQQISISGRVIDLQNAEPLPSSTISAYYKGRLSVIIANKDGDFNLQLFSVPDSMIISMIGYRSKKINGGAGFNINNLTISLGRSQTYTQLFENYHPGGGPQEAMKSSFQITGERRRFATPQQDVQAKG
jgi:hypothetical protein